MIFQWKCPVTSIRTLSLCVALALSSNGAYGLSVPELPADQPRMQLRYLDLRVPRQDLLFSNFQRPGRAADISDPLGSYQARVFTYESASPQMFSVGSTVGTPMEQSYGGTLALGVAGPLSVNMGYIGGHLQWSEEDYLFNPPMEQRADSWNLGAETHWLERSLNARVEYAKSEQRLYHNDREITTPGQAMAAEISVSSDGRLGSGWFDRWQGTAVYRSVDQNYYSLGNLDPLRGLDAAQLRFHSELGALGLALEWKLEGRCDTVGVGHFDPTSNRSGVQLNYRLPNPFAFPLGKPVVSARYYQVSQWSSGDQVASYGYSNLQQAEEAGLNLQFDYGLWRWSVDYLISEQDHQRLYQASANSLSDQPSDQVHQTAQLLFGWSPSSRFWMNLNARWHDQQVEDLENRYQFRNYGMQAYLGDLPQNLSMRMEYYFADQANSLGQAKVLDTQYRSHTGNARITWQALPERGRQPALDVYLLSSFNRQFNLANELDLIQWSASIGIELFLGRY